jgi:hypothetical protein
MLLRSRKRLELRRVNMNIYTQYLTNLWFFQFGGITFFLPLLFRLPLLGDKGDGGDGF